MPGGVGETFLVMHQEGRALHEKTEKAAMPVSVIA